MKALRVVLLIGLLSIGFCGSECVAESNVVDNSNSSQKQEKCEIRIGGIRVSHLTHRIVIADKATPTELHAAKEFQSHVYRLTGEQLEIVKPDALGKLSFVSIGRTNLPAIADLSIDWESLGPDGIAIRTAGANLVLAGNQRGVLYACYTFMEDYLGIHWFTPGCTSYPESKTINVPQIDITYVPTLKYREVHFGKAFNPNWIVRNRCNGYMKGRLGPNLGGEVAFGGVHSFSWRFFPSRKYFKKHPEYYALVNGKRVSDGQVCLTNPDVERIVVDSILTSLRHNPQLEYVSVSQNDVNGKNCQCPTCKAIDDREGSPAGTMIWFVNRVAEKICKDYPNLLISTLAYQYTRQPPKTLRPHPNVIVILCDIECSFAQPLFANQNRKFRDNIEAWGKICDRLYIWDYQANFPHYFQPHPSAKVLQPNLKYFLQHGAKGVFVEGYHGPGGDLHELRMWLLAKLLWNPDQNAENLIDTFLRGYYGDAAPYMRKYVDLMSKAAKDSNTYLDCFSPWQKKPYLTQGIIQRAAQMFDQAEQAVKDQPELIRRVRISRQPVRYMQIQFLTKAIQKREGKAKERLLNKQKSLLAEFKECAQLDGVTRVAQYGAHSSLDGWLAEMWRRSAGEPATEVK